MTVAFIKGFGGMRPNMSPRLIAESEAQVAHNTYLTNGAIRPYKAGVAVKTLTGAIQTIYRYNDEASDVNYWLQFNYDADVIRSAVNADQFKRVYWTGGDYPRYAPREVVLSSAPYPGNSYKLGVPRPTVKPTAAGSAVPVYTQEKREYVVTFASSTTETAPSPTLVVLAVDTFEVKITGIPVPTAGGGYTEKRLYRRDANVVGSQFRLVATLALDATEYTDTVPNASLGAVLSTSTQNSIAVPTNVRATADTVALTPTAKVRQYAYAYGGFTVQNLSGGFDFSSQYYEEGTLSASSQVTVDETQTVTLSAALDSSFTSIGATYIRIYRRDSTTGTWLRIAQIPAPASGNWSYVDSTTTATGTGIGTNSYGSAPVAATLTASTSTAVTNSTLKTHVYCLTFVGSDGAEGKRSAESNTVKVDNGVTKCTLTWDAAPATAAKARLYRRTITYVAGVDQGTDADYKLVAELPATTINYSDVASDSAISSNTALPVASRGLTYIIGDAPFASSTIPVDKIPETRVYCYTYVTAYDEEGPPSDASDEVEIDPEEPVTISGMAVAPAGNYNITKKRIYRSAVGNNTTTFQFVAEVAVASGSYTDSIEGSALGEVLPSESWVAPPENLKGLCLGANGIAAGFVDNNVYLSEAFRPHAWPEEYILTTEHTIVGIAPFGQNFAVLTTSFPYLITGSDPAAVSMIKLDMPEACVSKRSILATKGGVLYASPDGLILISNQGINNMSAPLLNREQWQAYNPTTMFIREYNSKIYVFHDDGGIIFDFTGESASMVTIDMSATAAYYDALTDNLYYYLSGSVYKWNTGADLEYVWRTKLITFPLPVNLSFCQIESSDYPVTCRVYAGGDLVHTQTVLSREPFRLPSGFKTKDWEVELEGTAEVFQITLASTRQELRGV